MFALRVGRRPQKTKKNKETAKINEISSSGSVHRDPALPHTNEKVVNGDDTKTRLNNDVVMTSTTQTANAGNNEDTCIPQHILSTTAVTSTHSLEVHVFTFTSIFSPSSALK